MLGKHLVLVALGCGLAACARADRDIVYSETRYRWSSTAWKDYGDTPRMTVEPVGDEQLYRINPDGSGKTRLLPKGWSGSSPLWSPDGRWILFMGHHDDPYDAQDFPRLYLIGENGGTPRLVYKQIESRFIDYCSWGFTWSPNATRVAVALREPGKGRRLTILVDPWTRNRTTIEGYAGTAWSPDSRRVYAQGPHDRGVYLDAVTGAARTAGASLIDPVWLPDGRLADAFCAEERPMLYIGTVGRDGRARKDVQLRQVGGREVAPLLRCASLSDCGGRTNVLGLSATWSRSDGGDYGCFRVDLARRTVTHLWHGPLLALSPDGRRFLSCTYDWVGPYKRGGERLGALVIGPFLSKGKPRRLTANMVSIGGADWRKRPPTAAAHRARHP